MGETILLDGLNETREKRNLAVYLGVSLIPNELVSLRHLRLSVRM